MGRIQSAHVMLCLTSCQHTIVSDSGQEATSFFSKQQDKAVSMHTRGGMRSSISDRKKPHQGRKCYQLRLPAWNRIFFWESFKGINCSAIIHNSNSLREQIQKKKISDWLSDYPKLTQSQNISKESRQARICISLQI